MPLYSFRLLPNNFLEIAKWDDLGHQRPEDVNSISNAGRGKCSCLGTLRQPYCKHKKMVDKIVAAFPGTSFVGAFYDYDNEMLYHPDDGEGIPLTGAVDIKQYRKEGY